MQLNECEKHHLFNGGDKIIVPTTKSVCNHLQRKKCEILHVAYSHREHGKCEVKG